MTRLAVSYVLPKLLDHPVGGYKVHYQYADELARRGHTVTLVHPLSLGSSAGLRERVTSWRLGRRARRSDVPPITWFAFDPSVRSLVVPALAPEMLPDADATILTAWQTAEQTREAPVRIGALFQVVYDYEFWMTRPDLRVAIAAALRRPDVEHVATSVVVAGMLRELGIEPVATIPAGLTDGEFGLDVDPERRGVVVGFALRFQPSKDSRTALEAIELIHTAMPEARFVCYGGARDPALPPWVDQLGRVSSSQLRAFYNRCAVFLLTSAAEGWGLPALEAMACGAAVVSTASGGVTDFLEDGANGLVVPVGDGAAVANAACALLRDPARRSTLARQAVSDVSGRTTRSSADRLEALLVDRVHART